MERICWPNSIDMIKNIKRIIFLTNPIFHKQKNSTPRFRPSARWSGGDHFLSLSSVFIPLLFHFPVWTPSLSWCRFFLRILSSSPFLEVSTFYIELLCSINGWNCHQYGGRSQHAVFFFLCPPSRRCVPDYSYSLAFIDRQFALCPTHTLCNHHETSVSQLRWRGDWRTFLYDSTTTTTPSTYGRICSGILNHFFFSNFFFSNPIPFSLRLKEP